VDVLELVELELVVEEVVAEELVERIDVVELGRVVV